MLCARSTLSYLKDTLYYFEDAEDGNQFFAPENSLTLLSHSQARIIKPKGCINLRDVKSLRFSARKDLPENGKGLEIHTSSRIWLVSCSAADTENNAWNGAGIFDEWVHRISRASDKKPKKTSTSQEEKSRRRRSSRRGSKSGRTRRHSRSSSMSQDEVYSTSRVAEVADEGTDPPRPRLSSKAAKLLGVDVESGKHEQKMDFLPDVAGIGGQETASVDSVEEPETKVAPSINSKRKSTGNKITTGLKSIASAVLDTINPDDFLHSSRDTDDDPSDQTFSFYLTSGWVYKRGGLMKSWKKRWFEHQNGTIQYFTKKGGKLKGELVIRDAKISVEGEAGFNVSVPGRTLECKCENFAECEKWIKVLKFEIMTDHILN